MRICRGAAASGNRVVQDLEAAGGQGREMGVAFQVQAVGHAVARAQKVQGRRQSA